MVICCVYGCSQKPVKGGPNFFRIPTVRENEGEQVFLLTRRRRALWLSRINRKDLREENVTSSTRICPKHFVSGKPAYYMSHLDPDWAPSLHLGYGSNANPELAQKRLERTNRRRALSNITNAEALPLPEPEPEPEPSTKDAMTQTDLCSDDFIKFEENEKIAMASTFTEESLRYDNYKVKYYTGVHSFELLKVVFDMVSQYSKRSDRRTVLSQFQELCIVLLRLRLNLQEEDLAYRFNIDQSTVSRIIDAWLPVMAHALECLIIWPDRETLKKTMPECFQDAFGTSVTVIIDCFEIHSESASALLPKAQLYSYYKHFSSCKVLIGITPQGTVCYVSLAWGGRSSDHWITVSSGFLNKLLPGDVVLADRGFDIADDVGLLHARVLIPCFRDKKRNQLAADELEITREIAQVRVHVERVIGLVRRKYRILDSKLHHSWLAKAKGEKVARIDHAIRVCCALANLSPPIVPITKTSVEIFA
ncbi:Cocaine esterase [Frankliniella fusca]|uniref:Cocaine esterase n=1 Tax=Frankliniella fusca TaxID=407009 RepID=A0AAE1HE29_9NEOP|nr:Cocaine esterase [Frankliniella fusca]KAK3929124.1 Cocaine esterase [Frankliniella fusca]